MFDYQGIFHVGVRVLDIESSMTSVGKGLGLTWAQLAERDMPYWTPASGPAVAHLKFVYSKEGPQHVELLEGSPGSVWDATDAQGPGLHHSGVWVTDVAEATEQAVAAGWTLLAANKSPEDGYGTFSYVRSPEGFVLEPVNVVRRPFMEAWFAGEALA
ncbi:MAG: VOC family protein [Acidimicrobiia bacterium]